MKTHELQAKTMLHKIKPFPLLDPSGRLFALSQTCHGILLINWVMQGMRGMERKELTFRLLLEVALTLFFGLCLETLGTGGALAFLLALLLAHSLNFFFNGQLWVCLRYCDFYRQDPEVIAAWRDRCFERLVDIPIVDEAVCIGSQACGRGTPGERSDIDLRLFFVAGMEDWLAINLLMLRLRTSALFDGIPLDLYACDSPSSLDRFDRRKPVGIIKDRGGRLVRKLGKRGRWLVR